MKFQFDHDLHIHSQISLCSNDPGQSKERIFRYAQENGLHTVCITDHFWDSSVEGASDWYSKQDLAHISKSKPLPQSEEIRFLFGCETEMNRFLTVGIAKEHFELFDFIIIPTTHFHMTGYTLFEEDIINPQMRAKSWVKRLDHVLDMDFPFHKVGLPHLTSNLLSRVKKERVKEVRLETISSIPANEMYRLFTKAARLGVGIELNASDMGFADSEQEIELRPYRIAKECGCKFYCGSDAHHPDRFESVKETLERVIDLLELEEDDKFII